MGSCSSSENDQDQHIPQFFKVFLPDHCSLNMRIPDAFRVRVTGKLPNKVILKNCNGKLWPVEIAAIGDGLYFQGGWPKFVLDNSLSLGEFMVFKYNGHHVFDVKILGINGCDRNPVAEEEEEEEEVGEEIEEEKEEEDDDDDEYVEEDEEEDEDDEYDEEDEEEKDEGKCRINLSNVKLANDEAVSEDDVEEMQEEIYTSKFIPQKNPSFIWEVRQPNSKSLVVPNTMIKDYHLKSGDKFILQDSKGRKWLGKLHKWQHCPIWVVKGWESLRQRNKVRKGDTVTFEFFPGRNGTCKTIKVHISRGK